MEGRCKRCNKRLFWFKEVNMYRGEEYCNKCYGILSRESKKGIEINGSEIVKKGIIKKEEKIKPEPDKKSVEDININDKGGIGWLLIGLLSSGIGVILFVILRKKYPKRAKSLLLGVGLNIAIPIVIFGIMVIIELISGELT